MSGLVCWICAHPAMPDSPVAFDERPGRTRGRLVHMGGDWGCWYCEPPAGHARCAVCERVHPARGMLHAQAVMEVGYTRRSRDDSREWAVPAPLAARMMPYGSPVPLFHGRIRRRDEASSPWETGAAPAGIRGWVVERNDDSEAGAWLVCAECAERLGGDWQPFKAWPGETADGPQAGPAVADPLAAWPHDDAFRTWQEIGKLVGKRERAMRDLLGAAERAGGIEVTERPTPGGGRPTKLYRRVAQP